MQECYKPSDFTYILASQFSVLMNSFLSLPSLATAVTAAMLLVIGSKKPTMRAIGYPYYYLY